MGASSIKDPKENKFEEPYQTKEEKPGMTLTKKKDVCFREDKATILMRTYKPKSKIKLKFKNLYKD